MEHVHGVMYTVYIALVRKGIKYTYSKKVHSYDLKVDIIIPSSAESTRWTSTEILAQVNFLLIRPERCWLTVIKLILYIYSKINGSFTY